MRDRIDKLRLRKVRTIKKSRTEWFTLSPGFFYCSELFKSKLNLSMTIKKQQEFSNYKTDLAKVTAISSTSGALVPGKAVVAAVLNMILQ